MSRARPARKPLWLVLLILLALGSAAWLLTGRKAAPPAPAAPAPAATEDPAARAAAGLLGRWERADGGYVLELRRLLPGQALEAAYFNPSPVHVSRAAWRGTPEDLRVLVELRDVNYPGATYTLRFDPVRGSLRGQYYQPALQQMFEVEFARAGS